MQRLDKIVALGMLIGAIVFNLWLYRLEPTATIDPNDNAFQFALVDRTNQIWNFAHKKCQVSGIKYQVIPIIPNIIHDTCVLTLLVDHWVPNWAEGYNLPFYYSHVPQIFIVGSYKIVSRVMYQVSSLFHLSIPSLFQYYHWIIYLLLSLFPLSVFLALRVIKLPWLTAGIGALLATHISTDGFYGLDPSSFLWRGYGLTSQLFAMIWLPLAIAYSYRFFEDGKWKFLNLNFLTSRYFDQDFKKSKNQNQKYQENPSSRIQDINFFLAVLFTTLTAMGHLGLGLIAMISLVPMALAEPIRLLMYQSVPSVRLRINNASEYQSAITQLKINMGKLAVVGVTTIFFLSYWVVPIVLSDNYHNFSFWDPIWKFNSYGWKEVLTRLLNGGLFDFGRFPWMTILIFIGMFATLTTLSSPFFSLALLFVFWLLLYFGRTTWGSLLDIIPGLKEFHQSRFIVGIHVAGLFLAPIGIEAIVSSVTYRVSRLLHRLIPKTTVLPSVHWFIRLFAYSLISLFILPPIYRQTIKYNQLNETLIKQANDNHAKVRSDEKELFTTLRSLPPGRVFTGRGGWWGKDFKVAETPYYMHLSTYGIPTVLWLPQTWSPNSDIEQYFSEDQARDYDLYNMRYVATPPQLTHGQKPQPFWKLLKQTATWKLYEVPTSGYFTTGVRAAIVSTKKTTYGNVVRLWIQSEAHEKKLYPELTFDADYPKPTGLPNFRMIDEANYVIPDNSRHNVFAQPPTYYPPNWEKISYDPHATPSGNLSYLPMKLIGPEKVDSDMTFKTKVEVGKNCVECLVILKQSFHPNWRATIGGKPVKPITVFPFFTAIPVPEGTHDIVFSYEPSKLKVILIVIEALTLIVLIARTLARVKGRD